MSIASIPSKGSVVLIFVVVVVVVVGAGDGLSLVGDKVGSSDGI